MLNLYNNSNNCTILRDLSQGDFDYYLNIFKQDSNNGISYLTTEFKSVLQILHNAINKSYKYFKEEDYRKLFDGSYINIKYIYSITFNAGILFYRDNISDVSNVFKLFSNVLNKISTISSLIKMHNIDSFQIELLKTLLNDQYKIQEYNKIYLKFLSEQLCVHIQSDVDFINYIRKYSESSVLVTIDNVNKIYNRHINKIINDHQLLNMHREVYRILFNNYEIYDIYTRNNSETIVNNFVHNISSIILSLSGIDLIQYSNVPINYIFHQYNIYSRQNNVTNSITDILVPSINNQITVDAKNYIINTFCASNIDKLVLSPIEMEDLDSDIDKQSLSSFIVSLLSMKYGNAVQCNQATIKSISYLINYFYQNKDNKSIIRNLLSWNQGIEFLPDIDVLYGTQKNEINRSLFWKSVDKIVKICSNPYEEINDVNKIIFDILCKSYNRGLYSDVDNLIHKVIIKDLQTLLIEKCKKEESIPNTNLSLSEKILSTMLLDTERANKKMYNFDLIASSEYVNRDIPTEHINNILQSILILRFYSKLYNLDNLFNVDNFDKISHLFSIINTYKVKRNIKKDFRSINSIDTDYVFIDQYKNDQTFYKSILQSKKNILFFWYEFHDIGMSNIPTDETILTELLDNIKLTDNINTLIKSLEEDSATFYVKENIVNQDIEDSDFVQVNVREAFGSYVNIQAKVNNQNDIHNREEEFDDIINNFLQNECTNGLLEEQFRLVNNNDIYTEEEIDIINTFDTIINNYSVPQKSEDQELKEVLETTSQITDMICSKTIDQCTKFIYELNEDKQRYQKNIDKYTEAIDNSRLLREKIDSLRKNREKNIENSIIVSERIQSEMLAIESEDSTKAAVENKATAEKSQNNPELNTIIDNIIPLYEENKSLYNEIKNNIQYIYINKSSFDADLQLILNECFDNLKISSLEQAEQIKYIFKLLNIYEYVVNRKEKFELAQQVHNKQKELTEVDDTDSEASTEINYNDTDSEKPQEWNIVDLTSSMLLNKEHKNNQQNQNIVEQQNNIISEIAKEEVAISQEWNIVDFTSSMLLNKEHKNNQQNQNIQSQQQDNITSEIVCEEVVEQQNNIDSEIEITGYESEEIIHNIDFETFEVEEQINNFLTKYKECYTNTEDINYSFKEDYELLDNDEIIYHQENNKFDNIKINKNSSFNKLNIVYKPISFSLSFIKGIIISAFKKIKSNSDNADNLNANDISIDSNILPARRLRTLDHATSIKNSRYAKEIGINKHNWFKKQFGCYGDVNKYTPYELDNFIGNINTIYEIFKHNQELRLGKTLDCVEQDKFEKAIRRTIQPIFNTKLKRDNKDGLCSDDIIIDINEIQKFYRLKNNTDAVFNTIVSFEGSKKHLMKYTCGLSNYSNKKIGNRIRHFSFKSSKSRSNVSIG